MSHRAEQVMAAVTATLTGLPTTGDNVFRGRVHALQDSELPAITIYQGDDRPLGEYGLSNYFYLDSELSIRVVAHVKTSGQAETLLNKIRREVHVALMDNYRQGLPDIVLTTVPRGAGEPSLTGDGETPTSTMELYWDIQYRSSQTDPGV